MKTILVAAAYNEEGKVGTVVKRGKPFVDEVLIVDDGSKDNTYNEAKEAGAIMIKLEKNQGVGAAMRMGMKYAAKNKYDVAIFMGGDNQDSPEEIPRLLKKIEEGYDFVQGSRYLPGGATIDLPKFRQITTKLHSALFNFLVGNKFKVTDGTNGFRAYKTSIFKDPRIKMDQKWLNRYELEVYLYYKIIDQGYKLIETPVTKSYPPGKSYSKMIPIISWWSITKPLIYLKFGIKK